MADHKPYVVIFKNSTPSSVIDEETKKVESQGGKIKQRFDSEIMKGFAATMPTSHADSIQSLSAGGKHEHIDYIEPDSEVKTQ
ncbi:hypothetical protein BDZ90DRAFT_257640 [Jaminaea rosea]|uniref:Inhibitor I9 domain-containing protein n=1 Tax=Jaminaea rosea TaxID=1569628 RepID=A0A316UZB4_9BASI|nr:hypothetical protein BDZ90DRAFT_257640 [Jaminaea rosea]PWN30562.1 hypothetical protein BDZ90DRAFT_257640 [Jaminaea rosea]